MPHRAGVEKCRNWARMRGALLCGNLAATSAGGRAWAITPGPQAAPPPPPQAAPLAPADPWSSPEATGAYPQVGYPPPDGGFVRLDLRADAAGVRLDRVLGQGTTIPVCFAPCSRLVARNDVYVIQGDGVRTTSQFQLPDDRSEVTLDVHAGSTVRLGGGAALLLGGGIVAYVGMITTEIGLATRSFADSTGTRTRSNGVTTVGLGLMGVGAAALIGGIYLVLTSSTKVTSSSGATFTNQDGPRPRRRSTVAVTSNGLEF